MKHRFILIYQFENFDYEAFIKEYRSLAVSHEEHDSEVIMPMAEFKFRNGQINEEEYKKEKAREDEIAKGYTITTKGRNVSVKEDVILPKCKFLQDAIIRRYYDNKRSPFALSSYTLKKVLGREAKTLIDTLISLNYLRHEGGYKEGVSSCKYTIPCDTYPDRSKIHPISTNHQKIMKYKETLEAILAKNHEDYVVKPIKAEHGGKFYDCYVRSLNKIKIANSDGLDAFINQEIENNPDSSGYFDYLKHSLSKANKDIYSVDNSGRMYHCLTNCAKEAKQYLNIDFAMDCKNSHPLLFNYFIYQFLEIDIANSIKISEFLHDKINIDIDDLFVNGNDIDSVKNEINNKGQNIKDDLEFYGDINKIVGISKLSQDEIMYITLSSQGKLWDLICKLHPNKDRNEIKKAIFAEVFYSNQLKMNFWKEYGIEFKKLFPNVIFIINKWKRPSKVPIIMQYINDNKLNSETGTTYLSIAMMSLEAKISTATLKRMYAKRWNAVHIHECIVVLDDGNANHPTPTDICSIMKDVYQTYGLVPEFSEKEYHKDKTQGKMEVKKSSILSSKNLKN